MFPAPVKKVGFVLHISIKESFQVPLVLNTSAEELNNKWGQGETDLLAKLPLSLSDHFFHFKEDIQSPPPKKKNSLSNWLRINAPPVRGGVDV